MSLSILIPIYNRDVTLLVSSLAKLISKERIVGEIILLDDASDELYNNLNSKLAEGDFILYSRNEKNLGRDGTRQLLAQKARYAHLLFLDCDVKIIKSEFIGDYFDQVKRDSSVCTGGLLYDENKPGDCKFKLHWKYGTNRESKRNEKNEILLLSNFLIRKEIFLSIESTSPLEQYGHEDTLIGIELKKRNITIHSIDNPVLHEGLEENSVFIKKSLQAVENLVMLEKKVGAVRLAEHVKLYRWYKKFSGLFITGFIEKAERIFHLSILKNLNSCNPHLHYFDWIRLAHLIRLKKKKR